MINKIRLGKIFLSVFNGIYGIVAILMLSLGVHLARKHYVLIQKLKQYHKSTATLILYLDYSIQGDDLLCIVVLVAGSAAILLIIFDVFSIYTKNYQRLRILGFTLTMSCAIKLTIGCLFLITTQYPVEVKSRLQRNFNYYLENIQCETAQTFIEEEHDCCGIVNYTDYIYLNMSQEPGSCYRKISEVKRELKRQGCANKVKNYYMSRITDIGLIYLLVGVLESFGPFASFFLVNVMKSSSTSSETPTAV